MSDSRRWLPALRPDEMEELEACTVMGAGGRRMPLAELLFSWSAHVQRFEEESLLSADDPGAWTEHDYFGALHLRDRLDAALDVLPEARRSLAERVVTQVDERFSALTELDEPGLLMRVLPAEPLGQGWWWQRIPRVGPVREGLERLRD